MLKTRDVKIFHVNARSVFTSRCSSILWWFDCRGIQSR